MSKKLLCINVITIALMLMASTAFAAKLTIVTDIQCESLEVTAGNEVEVTTEMVVDVNGAVTNAGTLIMAGTSELKCSGTFTNTVTGAVTANSSKFTFDGAETQSIDADGESLYDAVFSTGAKSIDGNLTITNTLTSGQNVTIATEKTLSLPAASVATISGGSWTVTGNLSADDASEIVYTSVDAQTVIAADHGKLTHNGDGTLSLTAPLICGGLLTNTKGIFTAVSHNLTAPGIVWTAGSVTATPSGAWDIGTDGVNVNGGTFVATSGAFTVEGNWDMTGATAFTPGNYSVDFDGASAQTITSAGKPFYSVDISNTTAAVSLADKFEFNAAGTLTIDATATFALAGNEFDDNGGTITNTGTFQMYGDEAITQTSLSIPTGLTKFVKTGGATLTTKLAGLANVEFDSNGNTFTLGEDMTFITGNITVATGTTLNMDTFGITLADGKTVTNSGTWTQPTGGVFTCSGAATFAGSAVNFYQFSAVPGAAKTIQFAGGKTYTIANNITITGEDGSEVTLQGVGSTATLDNTGGVQSIDYVIVNDVNGTTTHHLVASNSYASGGTTTFWDFGVILFISDSDGIWNDADRWNQNRVPTSSDNVQISNAVTLDISPTVNDFTIDATKSLACATYTITVSGTSDINGTATISTGTYDANGSFDATGGTITFSDAGTLELASTVTSLGTLSGNGTVDYNGAAQTVFGDAYYNLTLSGSDTKTLGEAITTAGNLTNSVTLDVSASNFAISVAGNWANSGTFTPQSGTVTLVGNSVADQTVTTSDQAFYNLTLNNDEDTHVKAVISGILDVNNDLTLTDGTLDLDTNDPNVFIGNALSIADGAVWTKGDGTTTFDGDACTLTDNNGTPNNLGIIKVD